MKLYDEPRVLAEFSSKEAVARGDAVYIYNISNHDIWLLILSFHFEHKTLFLIFFLAIASLVFGIL